MLVRRLSSKGGGHEAVCQQGRWAPKGVDWGVPHRLEKGTSASEDPKGVDCEIPHWLGGERNILYKGVETSPLQTRFRNLEGKPKEDNIC